jgi:hypothetical protein
VALVDKTAEPGNISKLAARVLQKLFGALEALFGQPSVGRDARRLLERPSEVAGGQCTLVRDLGD